MRSQRVFILAPDTAEYEEYNSNRYSYIYHEVKRICDVRVLTSTFDHVRKRSVKRTHFANIVYLSEPGYRKNVSIGRVLSNCIFILKAFFYLLYHVRKNDIFFTSIPFNSFGFLGAILKKLKSCYLIIDIHDLLPESLIPLMKESGYPPLPKPLAKGWSFLRNFGIAHCDVLIGVSEDNVNKFKYLLREGVEAYPILLGVEIERINRINPMDLGNAWDDRINVVFAGTLGVKNDIATIITMLKRNSETLKNRINFFFLGDGELLSTIKEELRDLDFIYFKGRVCYEEFLAYLKGADIGINSFTKNTDVRYSYRVTDYFACEIAVVNNLSGSLSRDIETYEIGGNYEAGDPDSLYRQLIKVVAILEDNKYYFKPNLRKYVSEKLDRKIIYRPLIGFIKRHINAPC